MNHRSRNEERNKSITHFDTLRIETEKQNKNTIQQQSIDTVPFRNVHIKHHKKKTI